MVIENKVYVIDTKTFTILESYLINYENKDVIKPFYTKELKILKKQFLAGLILIFLR